MRRIIRAKKIIRITLSFLGIPKSFSNSRINKKKL